MIRRMTYTPAVKTRMKAMLEEHLPAEALEYAFGLWLEEPFSFHIKNSRSTCLGNYSFRENQHTITINNDLNKYQFLITFIHEIAHQRVFIRHKPSKRKPVMPHGTEWKTIFQQLMLPLLSDVIFPKEILFFLSKHLQNPPASTVRDTHLMAALRQYDTHKNPEANGHLLEHIRIGQAFRFRERVFTKIEERRTRVLCEEKVSRKRYTIPKQAVVDLIE